MKDRYPNGGDPKNTYDSLFASLGWIADKWKNTEIAALAQNLKNYDIVLFGAASNSNNPQNLENYNKEFISFISNGGLFMIVPAWDNAADWIKTFGKSFYFDVVPDTSGEAVAPHNPASPLNLGSCPGFPHIRLCGQGFARCSPEWIAANKTLKGNSPVVIYQEWGNGIVLLALTCVSRDPKWMFDGWYKNNLQSLWNFVLKKRSERQPLDINLTSTGNRFFGGNILRLKLNNRAESELDLYLTVTLYKNRKPVSTLEMPCSISANSVKELPIPYIIFQVVDSMRISVVDKNMGIRFSQNLPVPIDDLNELLAELKQKNGLLIEVIASTEKIIPGFDMPWIKDCIGKEKDLTNLLQKEIVYLNKRIETMLENYQSPNIQKD